MRNRDTDELPDTANSVDPIQAAIQIVAEGSATSVTMLAPRSARRLLAARVIAGAAGVRVEPVDQPGSEGSHVAPNHARQRSA